MKVAENYGPTVAHAVAIWPWSYSELYFKDDELMTTTAISSPKASTVSARSNIRALVRISLEAWMSMCVYSVSAVLSVGSGLAKG
jgi:hypothetical protein